MYSIVYYGGGEAGGEWRWGGGGDGWGERRRGVEMGRRGGWILYYIIVSYRIVYIYITMLCYVVLYNILLCYFLLCYRQKQKQ